MQLNGFEDLEQLVTSANIDLFNELVDKVAVRYMCHENKGIVPNCAGSAHEYLTRPSADVRVFECQID